MSLVKDDLICHSSKGGESWIDDFRYEMIASYCIRDLSKGLDM